MRRAAVVVLAFMLALAGLPAAGASTLDAGQANTTVLGVTDVTTTPQPAVPGESVTVSVTVTNQAPATAVAEVEAVALRTARDEELDEFDRVRGFGTLGPGTSVTADLSVSFDRVGTRRLRAVVYARDADGDRVVIEAPVTVTVEDDQPSVDVAVDSTVQGTRTTATVTVANGLSRDLRSVAVSLDGVETVQERRIDSRVAAGETATFTFDAEAGLPGTTTARATVDYETSTGVERSTTARTRFEVEALEERVTFDVSRTERAVAVTVTNLGNTDARSVVLEGSVVEGDTGVDVGGATIPRVPPGEAVTVNLPVDGLDPTASATVGITAQYGIEGRPDLVRERETRTVRFEQQRTPTPTPTPEVPAEITLTGIEVVEEGDGRVRITGSASNVGLDSAQSVVVRVVDSETVTPAEPREYFVGTVPPSDFVSFDVFAHTDGATAIPIEVSYLAAGERRTARFTVELEEPSTAEQVRTPNRERPLLIPAIAGGAVVLVAALFILIGWRSRRDDR